MRTITLGLSGIQVTELCFGALPIGPNQKDVPADEAAEVIAEALRAGINFVDTAEIYKTYPYIREAVRRTGIQPVIATKSPASTYEDMCESVEKALAELAVSKLDIFLLHAARVGEDVFEKRAGALQCLLDYKARGIINAVGISTHDAKVAALAADRDDIDVLFPILNIKGLGILNGSRADMENAAARAMNARKGVYLMKALGGGNLAGDYEASMEYARGFANGRAALAVGMVNTDELAMNVKYFNGESIEEYRAGLKTVPKKRFLVVPQLCAGCGNCVEACHSGAARLEAGRAVIDDGKCVTCGYCVGACGMFAIRMV
ncbi:MAG: aldo/keto reductase [Clostridiales bacterium]|jgi:aryl-alcohol dehydrogenase-like predicted oxidoreductase/Pyruvate/2-oxoacid:ferredoxin oxidoreductase delta subunit|nr:aldo/keto reductase [Clostridiales bacterium]